MQYLCTGYFLINVRFSWQYFNRTKSMFQSIYRCSLVFTHILASSKTACSFFSFFVYFVFYRVSFIARRFLTLAFYLHDSPFILIHKKKVYTMIIKFVNYMPNKSTIIVTALVKCWKCAATNLRISSSCSLFLFCSRNISVVQK